MRELVVLVELGSIVACELPEIVHVCKHDCMFPE